MTISQSSWLWFLFLVILGVFSHELYPKCQELVDDFHGVATPNRSVCIIVPVFGKYVHLNITKKSPGTLYVNGLVCDDEPPRDLMLKIDGEHLDIRFYLPYYAAKRNCNPDDVENVRMMFRSDSESVIFSVTMLREYETNRTLDGIFQNTSNYENDEMIKNIELKTSVKKVGSYKVLEYGVIIVLGVGYIAFFSFLGYEKILRCKIANRRRDSEMELLELQSIQPTPESEPSLPNDNVPGTSESFNDSNNSEDPNTELASNLP